MEKYEENRFPQISNRERTINIIVYFLSVSFCASTYMWNSGYCLLNVLWVITVPVDERPQQCPQLGTKNSQPSIH